jgi:hypothetical protein
MASSVIGGGGGAGGDGCTTVTVEPVVVVLAGFGFVVFGAVMCAVVVAPCAEK